MGVEELADRLSSIAEELADLALDHLHEASSMAGRGQAPDPEQLAEERRLTRARRAVEKAANVLRGPGAAVDDDM